MVEWLYAREFMKQDRIELRASRKERELLLEAATCSGMTLSGFLRQAALEKSDNVLKNRDILTLSDRDRDLFLHALENPPQPNKRLLQAFKTYKRRKNITPKVSTKSKRKKKYTERV